MAGTHSERAPGSTARPASQEIAALVTDQRPLVRAGLETLLAEGEAIVVLHGDPIQPPPGRATVLIVVLDPGDADPFERVATATALHDDLHVLLLADDPALVDLREGVVAGVDSFLLTTVTTDQLADAVRRTARGDRVIAPEFAMQLAESWRSDTGPTAAALTARELEVLSLIAEGLTNKGIAQRLGLSPRTIKTHVQNILGKLDVPDRTAAVARAFRLGLIR